MSIQWPAFSLSKLSGKLAFLLLVISSLIVNNNNLSSSSGKSILIVVAVPSFLVSVNSTTGNERVEASKLTGVSATKPSAGCNSFPFVILNEIFPAVEVQSVGSIPWSAVTPSEPTASS